MLDIPVSRAHNVDKAHTPLCGSGCNHTLNSASDTNRPIADFFSKLFDTGDFPARWHCGNWTDFHGWLYILSDVAIWLAYFTIPVLLLRIMIKRKDVAFNGVIYLFLAFVLLCGLTHLIDAVIFWWPAYRLSALLRLATAIVSIIAAYALSRSFPALLGLRSVRELKREIGKRKRTEERLSDSEFLLSEAGRIARVGGWEYDLVTRKYSLSKTVYEILEIPADFDIYQYHPLSYYPDPFRGLLEKAALDAIKTGTKWDIETLAITTNNNSLWVRHIGEPVFNQQGEVVKIRGTLTDIDQYKKHELELSRLLKSTQEKSEQLKKFSYVLSHNIRNHTSNLAALADLAEVDNLDEDNKEVILKSKQVTGTLTKTLDDLAEVIEAQHTSVVEEVVNFESVAAKVLDGLSLAISQANAQISLSFAVPEVRFSTLYLDSVLKHLLSNAIRYRNPARVLNIELKSFLNDTGQTVLECRDNGLGINLNQNGAKLFNLYATFHPSLSARGVGLFLIKAQIESQGGEITVRSKLGEGTVFQALFGEKDVLNP
ncbi:sensor histidine kinase [Mucilaginibacter lacusdianchii]|uniref:sensor histidine kinase n=1 Tax=Mucilaginibacter lacusdianchii TaxID=2684211 RepID=UPI00131EBA1B|nr:HAMP domain-containing sensor histidine kinase [Mucilaginibacter sp. JXJ CY 39]